MPATSEINDKIKVQFDQLESEARRLLEILNYYGGRYYGIDEKKHNYISEFQRLKTNFLNLLQFLSVKPNSYTVQIKEVQSLSGNSLNKLHGIISGFQNDYNQGLLRSITETIETNVVADFLTQAERLLKNDKRGIHTYGPAAVLAGAVLEDGLRRICDRQSPPISTNKRGGHPKAMSILIDDLKKSNVFNELKAKQLRAWADIRNAAAHGRFNEFERTDVAHLIPGVESFLADYL